MADQVIALENEADGVVPVGIPIRVFEGLSRFAFNDQIAGIIPIQSADHVQQRGLPRTRRAKDSDEFLLAERHRDIVQRFRDRIADVVILLDVL